MAARGRTRQSDQVYGNRCRRSQSEGVQRPWLLLIPIQSLSGEMIAVYCHSIMLRRAILHWNWHWHWHKERGHV